MTAPIAVRRSNGRGISPRMQMINEMIAAKRAEAEVHVPVIAAVVTTDADRIAALEAEVARLKETITAAQQRLAEAEHERRALKLAASVARLNAEFAEAFGDDAAPLITDDIVQGALARAERKVQEQVIETETAAEVTTAAEAEVSVQITSPEPTPEPIAAVETEAPIVVTADNPFIETLRAHGCEVVVTTDTAAETGAVKAEVEVKTQPYTTDHGTVYTPVPEPDFYTTFASYEPEHVVAVAQGAAARFVAAPGRRWLVAARADQIDSDTGEVVVRRADGSTTVPILGDVLARLGSVGVYEMAVA